MVPLIATKIILFIPFYDVEMELDGLLQMGLTDFRIRTETASHGCFRQLQISIATVNLMEANWPEG